MSKIYIGDQRLFENTIESLENSVIKIKEVFNSQNKNFEKINGTDIWTSKTQQSVCYKYEELKTNYEYIEEALEKYINFLRTTLSTYQAFDQKVNTDSESIKVN